MKEIEVLTKIIVKEDGEILGGVKQEADMPDNESEAENYFDEERITEAEKERYAVASELANVCDYLEDSEIIKLKLIIQKAQVRKERAENRDGM